jgi:hypothetical protein
MVARFIAVGILTDQAGYIALGIRAHTVMIGKKLIQLSRKPFLSSEQPDQTVRILGSKERVLPSVTFCKVSYSCPRR